MPKQTILLLGHSFVTRLARYAATYHAFGLNLRLEENEVVFHGVPGTALPQLRLEVDMVQTLQPTIVFLEVGTNDLRSRDPDDLAEEVAYFAKSLLDRYGVR